MILIICSLPFDPSTPDILSLSVENLKQLQENRFFLFFNSLAKRIEK